jgi:hypothetical protein
MVDEKAVAFLNETLEKTKARKLNWQATAENGVFIAPMGGKYIIKVFPYYNSTVKIPLPSLKLYEEEILLLDCNGSTASGTFLVELYQLVKDQISGVDKKSQSIDQAISVLKNL